MYIPHDDPYVTTPVYNPDDKDFEIDFDLNGNQKPVTFVAHSREINHFPKVVADHIKKHLAQHLVFKRGIKLNFQADFDKTLKELST